MDDRSELPTQPFGKTSTKGQSRVNPSICVIDVVARGRKGNGHFRERLQDSPDACADQQVCNNHVARATTRKSSAGTDEQPRSDVGTERYNLEKPVSADSHPEATC